MPTDFFPKTDEGLLVWFTNFNSKFSQHAAGLGLAAETASVVNDLATLTFAINGNAAYQTEAKERAEYKKILLTRPVGTPAPAVPQAPTIAPPAVVSLPGILPRTRVLVNKIKLATNYNAGIGADLGIIGSQPSPPPVKPVLSATPIIGSRVELKFQKRGNPAAQIESQRGASNTWEIVAVTLTSPYIDVRPALTPNTPELRKYRAVYYKGSQAVGAHSDVVTVSTVP